MGCCRFSGPDFWVVLVFKKLKDAIVWGESACREGQGVAKYALKSAYFFIWCATNGDATNTYGSREFIVADAG